MARPVNQSAINRVAAYWPNAVSVYYKMQWVDTCAVVKAN